MFMCRFGFVVGRGAGEERCIGLDFTCGCSSGTIIGGAGVSSQRNIFIMWVR